MASAQWWRPGHPGSDTTDYAGIAETAWTLGRAVGTSRVEASVAGPLREEFSVSGLAGDAAAIRVAPDSLVLHAIDEQATLNATVLDLQGNVVEGRAITWSVADSNVVRVHAGGVVQALSNGRTMITAAVDSIHAGGGHFCGLTADGAAYC